MTEELYEKILEGRKPEGQHLHYYALLNVKLFESDGKAIHKAGLIQMKKLKDWQLHPDAEIQKAVQEMLNRISMACTVLEVAEKKEEYDKKLALELNIDLSQDASYRILSIESELQACPNCGAKVSQLAILCIECGYNFETKQVLKTKIETHVYDDDYRHVDHTTHYAGTANSFNPLALILRLALPVIAILAVLLVGVVLYFIFRADPRYDLTGKWRDRYDRSNCYEAIDDSELWQTFLKYKCQKNSSPCVRINMIHGVEFERGRASHEYSLEVVDSATKEVIHTGSLTYIRRYQYDSRIKGQMQNAAIAALSHLVKQYPEYVSVIKGKIESDTNTLDYLYVLENCEVPTKELKDILTAQLDNNDISVKTKAAEIINQRKLYSEKITEKLNEFLANQEDEKLRSQALCYFNRLFLPGSTWTVSYKHSPSRVRRGQQRIYTKEPDFALAFNTDKTITGGNKDFTISKAVWDTDENGQIIIELPLLSRLLYVSLTGEADFSSGTMTGKGSTRNKRRAYRFRQVDVDWTAKLREKGDPNLQATTEKPAGPPEQNAAETRAGPATDATVRKKPEIQKDLDSDDFTDIDDESGIDAEKTKKDLALNVKPDPAIQQELDKGKLPADGEDQLETALAYLRGKGKEKDVTKALTILQTLVKNNNTGAMVALADVYSEGKDGGLEGKEDVALDLYLKAQKDHPEDLKPKIQKLFQKVFKKARASFEDKKKREAFLAEMGFIDYKDKGYPVKTYIRKRDDLVKALADVCKFKRNISDEIAYKKALVTYDDKSLELYRIARSTDALEGNDRTLLILKSYHFLLDAKVNGTTKYVDELVDSYNKLQKDFGDKDPDVLALSADIFLELNAFYRKNVDTLNKKKYELSRELSTVNRKLRYAYVKSLKIEKNRIKNPQYEYYKSSRKHNRKLTSSPQKPSKYKDVIYATVNDRPKYEVTESSLAKLKEQHEEYLKNEETLKKTQKSRRKIDEYIKKYDEKLGPFKTIPRDYYKYYSG